MCAGDLEVHRMMLCWFHCLRTVLEPSQVSFPADACHVICQPSFILAFDTDTFPQSMVWTEFATLPAVLCGFVQARPVPHLCQLPGHRKRVASCSQNVAHWFLRQRHHTSVGWCSDVSCMFQICTYNPLTASTLKGCKLEEILFTLQTNHVIFLTGTERPRARCSPVTHSVLAGYRLFEWGYGMGRGTNRHAGLICETWQIREVASPHAGLQGRGGANREKTSKLDLLLIGLYPLPLSDWATDKLHDWADKMVHAAPSRCCVVVGGDLNAHVGYMRHPERDALILDRRPWRDVGSITLSMRTGTESACLSFVEISTW